MKTFQVWKQIQLGKKPSLKGINVSSYAQDMLDKVSYSKKKETISLMHVKVSELEIDAKYPTITQIVEKAKELGLGLCPAEVGPQLREQYQDQPMDEWLYVGMEPITDRGGFPGVFRVERSEGGLWLHGSWAGPSSDWSPDSAFVFCLRTLDSLKPLNPSDLESRVAALEAWRDNFIQAANEAAKQLQEI